MPPPHAPRWSTIAAAFCMVMAPALPAAAQDRGIETMSVFGETADTTVALANPPSGAQLPSTPVIGLTPADELPNAAGPANDESRLEDASPTDDAPAVDAPRTDPPSSATPPAGATPAMHGATPRGDLWERIRRGFRIPELDSPLVRSSEKFYAGKPDYVARMTERASRYLYHIVEEIERRGMPTELALLPFIESAFNPHALSSAKASGIWQFIPGTGKLYGLKQTMFQDERRDVLESTRAALDYLGKLHEMFGDWQLALAAYNWGEGAVQRAVDRNRKRGKPTDYASLKMPSETRWYVPKLQAVKNIVANPAEFGLELPAIVDEEYFTTVTKDRDIDVDTAARFAGMSVEEFRALNPSFSKPVIVGATMPQLVLPKDKAEQFLANLDFAQGSLSSYTAYRMDAGDTLESIAPRFGTTAMQLRDINGIPPGARLRTGATLLVPKPAGMEGDIPEHIAESATLIYDAGRPVRQITVKVRKGDTLARLASRHRVSLHQLASWNGLQTSARLQAGQSLLVQRVVAARPTASTKRVARKPAVQAGTRSTGRPSRAQAMR